MEVAFYAAFTTLLWISSVTILLPFLCLLKYSKFFRDRWFSFMFCSALNQLWFEPKLIPYRKKAFKLLKDNLSDRDQSKPFKVLEVGTGGGANFQFYPENTHLTALDMNAGFNSYLCENQKKYQHIVYERNVIGVAENMKDITDSTMDVVISTYVLCSVTSVKDSLREIKRVLKPGGKFLFLEHVSYPKTGYRSTIQNCINPLWKIYNDGCNVSRNIADEIKNTGFSDVIFESICDPSMVFFVRPQVYGLATK